MSSLSINNQPLRSQLEATVKAARDVAEKGAHAALSQLVGADRKLTSKAA